MTKINKLTTVLVLFCIAARLFAVPASAAAGETEPPGAGEINSQNAGETVSQGAGVAVSQGTGEINSQNSGDNEPLGAVVSAMAGETVDNSGLLFMDYTAYAYNSPRVLTDIFSDDKFKLDVRYQIPESISFTSDIKVQITGGGFDGVVASVQTDVPHNTVTISFDLTYTGSRTTQVIFNLSGKRVIGEGSEFSFNDPRNVTVKECRPDDNSGADIIYPSAPSEPPRFSVDLNAKFAAANAGQKYVFEIPVKNAGKQNAKEIVVSIDPGAEGGEFPFEYDKYAMTSRIAELPANQTRNARFELRVLPTAKNGPHTINVHFTGRSALGAGALGESSETIIINVNNTNTAPRLNLQRIGLSASALANPGGAAADAVQVTASGADAVKPGSNFLLTIYIQNSGTLAAKDVSFTLRGLRADGISTNNTPDVRYLNQIDGKSNVTQSFELVCAEDMNGDRTELSLSMRYTDETGKEFANDAQVFIALVKPPQKVAAHTGFEFINMSAPSGELREGANFTVSFAVLNTGETPMEDVRMTYSAGPEFIGKSLSTRMLRNIPPGDSVPLSYDFSVSKNYSTGNFPISFTIDFTPGDPDGDGSGGGGASGGGSAQARVSSTQYVGVLLNRPEEVTTTPTTTEYTTEGKESVPKIIVSNFEYVPKEAKAGQAVDVTLTFFNTSMTQDVKNIKILLESDVESGGAYGSASSSGVFTPIEGSNSFYIERIGPRQEEERSIRLMIKGDADAKSYPLYANIEYEDSKSNPISTKDNISIPVTQVTKVTINDVMINSPGVYLNQPFNIQYNFINMGKTTLYNVTATVEGPFAGAAQAYYSGNMTPGSQDYYDVSVMPDAEGEQIGYALITFEDAVGNVIEERKEFPFFVMDMPDYGGGMFDGKYPDMFGESEDMYGEGGDAREGILGLYDKALAFLKNPTKDPKILIAVGAGLLLLIIIISALVRRARRRRLERELNRDVEQELAADLLGGDELGGRRGGRGGDAGGNGARGGEGALGGGARGAEREILFKNELEEKRYNELLERLYNELSGRLAEPRVKEPPQSQASSPASAQSQANERSQSQSAAQTQAYGQAISAEPSTAQAYGQTMPAEPSTAQASSSASTHTRTQAYDQTSGQTQDGLNQDDIELDLFEPDDLDLDGLEPDDLEPDDLALDGLAPDDVELDDLEPVVLQPDAFDASIPDAFDALDEDILNDGGGV